MNSFAHRRWLLAGLLSLLAACSPQSGNREASPQTVPVSPGQWTLASADSRLSFVSIKNNSIAEVHRFRQFSGSMDESGNLAIKVPLASVATGIEIRDQRMRDLLFEVGKFPEATIIAALDAQQIRALRPGEHAVLNVISSLALHGIDNPLPAEVRITRVSEARWLATSERPMIVETVNFGLINGVDELRKVAGLQAIGSAIPVTFTFSFLTAPPKE